MYIISWRVCPFLGLYILFSFPLYTSRRISLVFRLKFSCLASYLVFAVYPLKIRFVMSSFPLDYSYLLIFFIALLVLIWSVSLVLLPYSFMGDSSLGLTYSFIKGLSLIFRLSLLIGLSMFMMVWKGLSPY